MLAVCVYVSLCVCACLFRARPHDVPSLVDDLPVDLFFRMVPLHSFVCHDASFVHVEIEEPHAANVLFVASVPPKPGAATVAHPQLGVFVFVDGQAAIIICVVTGYSC